MKIKIAKQKLEKMINGVIWKHDIMNLNEILLDDEKISDALDDLDNVEYLVDNINSYDINNCKIIYYGVDDDRCINALIVICEKQPLAIGYTGD